MFDNLTAKIKLKTRQYRALCLCSCGLRSPSTITSHRKLAKRKANIDALAIAQSVSSPTTGLLALAKCPPHQKPRRQPAEDYAPEDPMEVDQPQASRLGEPSAPLARIWANRASRREREDEDLVSKPGSPEPENEAEAENSGNQSPIDEPEWLSDDEAPPTHVEISATEELTASF
jgi:hypothetical protein